MVVSIHRLITLLPLLVLKQMTIILKVKKMSMLEMKQEGLAAQITSKFRENIKISKQLKSIFSLRNVMIKFYFIH